MTTFTEPLNVVDSKDNILFSVGSDAKGTMQTIKVATITGGSTTEVDTGYALPANAIIYDVFLNVLTPEVTGTTKTVSVGLLGTPTVFLNGISVAKAGVVRGVATLNNANNSFVSTTRGSNFGAVYAGGSTSTGLDYESPYTTNSNANVELSYKRGSTLTETVADIYVVFTAF